MEKGIPLPDAHIVDHGGRHGFARRIKAGGDQSGPHDPPGIIVLGAILLLHLRRAGEPIVPALPGIVDDFGRVRNIAVEP